MKLSVTESSDAAGKDANVKLLAARAQHLTSLQAEQGNYIKAKQINKKWDKLLDNNVNEINKGNASVNKVYKNF
jgi:hypothetical protein